MTPFRFRFAAVLDARVRAEDDARLPVLVATRSHEVALAEATRLRAEFERTSRAFAVLATGTAGRAFRDALVEIDLIANALARSEVAARAAAELVLIARSAFAVARRERKQIEALRDRARAAFERECEHRESDTLDEANGARHNAATLFASSFHNSRVT